MLASGLIIQPNQGPLLFHLRKYKAHVEENLSTAFSKDNSVRKTDV